MSSEIFRLDDLESLELKRLQEEGIELDQEVSELLVELDQLRQGTKKIINEISVLKFYDKNKMYEDINKVVS